MKRNCPIETISEPARLIRTITLGDEEGNQLPAESNLSPERIMDGASATTPLLSEILAQREQTHQFRDWGINE